MTDTIDHLLRERIAKTLDEQPVRVPDWHDVVRRGAPERRFGRGWGVRRPILVLIGVATCGVLLALGLALRGEGATGVGTAEAACRGSNIPAGHCLRALARLAEDGSAPAPVVYQRVLSYQAAPVAPPGAKLTYPRQRPLPGAKRAFMANAVQTIEMWVARGTRNGARRAGAGRLVLPTADDRAAWRAAGSPTWRRMAGGPLPMASIRQLQETYGGYAYPLRAWRTATGMRDPDSVLPTNVDAMLRLLRRVAKIAHGSGDPFTEADAPLHDPLLRPAQRAALLGVLARDPSVRVLGRMRDPLGREGVAISAPFDSRRNGLDDPWRWIYLYDPHTSRLLAEGAWPSGLSPRASGWRASLFGRVFAVTAAVERVPELTKGR